MEVTTHREGETLIARPHGRIDGLADATSLQKILEGAIESSDQALILDFENVSYISSAGLRTVAIMINRTRAADMGFVLCSLSGSIRDLFATSGFDKLVQVAGTLDDARWAVAAWTP